MTDIDPTSYSFKCGPKSYCNVHRFMAEKGLKVSAAEIRELWPRWDKRQRMEFAFIWNNKGAWTDNETEVLEIIMADGEDDVWQNCNQAFLKHPDRNRTVSFLVDRVLHYPLNHELNHGPLGYIAVLGMTKDTRAVAAIRPFYEKYRKIVDTEPVLGGQEDVICGPIQTFLVAAGALFKITGSPEYEQSIRKFCDHEKEQVRYLAEYELED